MKTALVSLILAFSFFNPSPGFSHESVIEIPIAKSAQNRGVGDGGAASMRGLSALEINPAGLPTPYTEIATQFNQLIAESNVTSVAIALPVRRINTTFAASYAGLTSSNFERRTSLGEKTGSYSTQNEVIGISAGRPFFLPWNGEPINIGLTIKRLQFKIDSSNASATAMDIGIRHEMKSIPLSLSSSLLNIGRGPVFERSQSKLPTSLLFAGSYRLLNSLDILGAYADRLAENEQEISCGTELRFGKLFALRAEYTFFQGGKSSSAGLQNLAAGVGVKFLGNSSLDYAFQAADSALRDTGQAGTHFVTLTFRFGDNSERGTR